MFRLHSCIAGAGLLLLAGCTHVNESSRSATLPQIEARLMPILGATSLQLSAIGRDHFGGQGKNSSGEFTIDVVREKNTISFNASYLPPAKGNVSGSTTWSRSRTSVLGFHSSRNSSKSSISSTQSSP